jgi:hypothetical protein
MAEPTKRKKWSDVKARLEAFDRKGLVSLRGELYNASVANRRFLHSRLTLGSRAIEEYRHLVAAAIYPDPFSKRRVSVREAAAAIVEYRRSRAMHPGPSSPDGVKGDRADRERPPSACPNGVKSPPASQSLFQARYLRRVQLGG